MISDERKLKVIFWIDRWQPALAGTCYEKDLSILRMKYVFKDISVSEWKRDVMYLKDIKDIIKNRM